MPTVDDRLVRAGSAGIQSNVLQFLICNQFSTVSVASPGFVASMGKAGNYVMGHSRRTTGCSNCSVTNSFVTILHY